MTTYDSEAVDRLPFATPEKADRYRTERYQGATGLNWYTADPSLQFLAGFYLSPEELAWAEPRLERLGSLMGGPVSARAEVTDKSPPKLVKYDRWGHDISEVVMPESALATKRDVLAASFNTKETRDAAEKAGVRLSFPNAVWSYMLNQAEIGMTCALGTGGDMVVDLVSRFAPPDVKEHVLGKFRSREWEGETAQLLTERTGGSDLGALETTAEPDGDAWRLNGLKWFASNANGQAYVVLAKPVGAADETGSIATFLVLKQRRDGSRNGVRIRQLKEKLGTKAVASGEVEFVDAEAFLLGPSPGERTGGGDGATGGGGLRRMMELTNGARLGIAMMGLGCARRALVEALCYAGARNAFGRPLLEQPLMRRKLAEMIVDVEAAQALVFDGYGITNHLQRGTGRLRLGAPVVKLKVARLGITAASDCVEIHGGNGYVETWPVARILRDAQVNTIWEGPDNILCLDVRRALARGADEPFIERIRDALGNGQAVLDHEEAVAIVGEAVAHLEGAIAAWRGLDGEVAEARLFPLSQFMGDVYAAALLVEQAAWEAKSEGTDRKALVARLFANRQLRDLGPMRGVDAPDDGSLSRFDDLLAGAIRFPSRIG